MPRFREILCYLLILAITLYLALAPLLGKPRLSILAPATQAADLAPPGPMLILQGRQIVGTTVLMRMTGNPPPKNIADVVQEFAATPTEKFCVLLVKREVADRAQAEADLAALAQQDPALRPYVDTVLHPQAASPAARAALVERFQWFGELGLSRDLPSDDPLRNRVLTAASRTSLTLLSGMAIGLVGAVIGLILLVIFFVFVAQEKVRRRLPTHPDLPHDPLPYLEGFTLYLLICFIAPYGVGLLTQNVWVAISLYFFAPIAAFLWARLRGQSWRNIRAATGLHLGPGHSLFREMGAGVVGYLIGLPALALAYVVCLLLISLSHANPSHPINNEISTDPRTFLKLFLLASVYAPLVEESLFRGFFYIHLRARLRPVAGAVFVSLIFAAIHPQGWTLIPLLATLGFTLAMIREYRGSAIANMTAHSLQNTFTLVLVTVALS